MWLGDHESFDVPQKEEHHIEVVPEPDFSVTSPVPMRQMWSVDNEGGAALNNKFDRETQTPKFRDKVMVRKERSKSEY